jgi:hypothetical protein
MDTNTIIAIILGALSFLILVLGILGLAGVIFAPYKLEVTSIDPNTCPSGGTVSVTYKYNGTTSDPIDVKCRAGNTYDITTKYKYVWSAKDPSKTTLTGDDIKLDRPLNIPGLIMTIFGLLGLIGSVAYAMMNMNKHTAANVNINPIVYKPSPYASPSPYVSSYASPAPYVSPTAYSATKSAFGSMY